MAVGYLAAFVYFSIGMLVHGVMFQGDFWVVPFWVAFYGFAIMSLIFLPPFLSSTGRSCFWHPIVCVPLAGLAGFAVLFGLFPPLALHYLYGGQAVIMSGVTYLMGSVLLRTSKQDREASATNLC